MVTNDTISGNCNSIKSNEGEHDNNGAYESTKSHDLPIVEPSFCKSISKSWTSLASIYTDSFSIVDVMTRSSEYQPFKRSLKSLFFIRIISLFIVIGLEAGVSYPINWMFSALSDKSPQEFYSMMYIFGIMALIAVPFLGFDFYINRLLYVKVRQVCTKVLLKIYHNNNIFYHLQSKSNLDNPGQRIVRDVDEWSYGTINFIIILIKELLRLIAWTFVLYTIGASMIIWVLVIGFIVVVVGISFFASKLTKYAFLITRDEANLIASLVKIRDNSETIAFYRAANFEEKWNYHRLLILLKDQKLKYKWESGLEILSKLVKYFGMLVPLIFLAPRILSGEMKFGVLTQSVMCFRELLQALTLIVSQMDRLSNIQASAKRVSEVIGCCNEINNELKNPHTIISVTTRKNNNYSNEEDNCNDMTLNLEKQIFNGIKYKKLSNQLNNINEEMKEDDSIIGGDYDSKKELLMEVRDINVVLPSSNILLIHNLNWKLYLNQNILIAGPSGTGKSSLIRVIAGLWRNGNGVIKKISTKEIMYVPQKPYLPQLPPNQNTINHQLLFPEFNNENLLNETYLTSGKNSTKNDYNFDNTHASSNDLQIRDKNIHTTLTENEMKFILRQVNLDYVLESHLKTQNTKNINNNNNNNNNDNKNENPDWSKLLSLGEQQRLAFARVLVRKPKLVFLDESTSALDISNQNKMYQLLKQYKITFVSVGHRSSLVQFHDKILHLNGNSLWKFMSKDEYQQIVNSYQ